MHSLLSTETMSRREHYSTALTQAQGIFHECLALFEIWEEGMDVHQLFETVQVTNALGLDSERRARNVVVEGFGSRFLREPYIEAAPSLKRIFAENRDNRLLKQLVLLYALRQHGLFFDFLSEVYWAAIRSGGQSLGGDDVLLLVDRGLITGKLNANWSESVRKRASSYVLGTAADFELLGKVRSRERIILNWSPHDSIILYLVYDLHFMGASDDEVANADEWRAIGLQRDDVTLYLNRLQSSNHLIAQDTGHLCRIDWKYQTREELADVILS
jgi:hypothetical protein